MCYNKSIKENAPKEAIGQRHASQTERELIQRTGNKLSHGEGYPHSGAYSKVSSHKFVLTHSYITFRKSNPKLNSFTLPVEKKDTKKHRF